MTIYLIRHGETALNRLGIAQGSGVDSDLNEFGEKQAHFFYKYYEHLQFDYVFTSALKRSQQTVKRFLTRPQTNVQHLMALNEISWGVNEGKKSDEASKTAYHAMMNSWYSGDYSAKMENGESIQEVADRLAPFVEMLRNLNANNVLICTHGRTMLCLLTLLQNEPIRNMKNYQHSNTGLYVIHVIDGEFHIEVQNSTQHISPMRKEA